MVETTFPGRRAAEALARFQSRNDPNGLFLHYCGSRLARLGVRLAVAYSGAAAFAVLADPGTGFAAALLITLGEAIDSAGQRAVLKRWSLDRPVPGPIRAAICVLAAFQAATVGLAATLVWLDQGAGGSEFFAAAFLTAVALDAGLTVRVHRGTALVRLGIFALACLAMVLHGLVLPETRGGSGHLLGHLALIVLAVVVWSCTQAISRSYDRRRADEWAVLAEQVRVEEARAALEEKDRQARQLALVARNANDGVVIYRPDGRIDWVNDTFTRITGYSADEVVGRFIEEVVPTPDPTQETLIELNRARREHRAYRGEFVVSDRLGQDVWLETIIVPTPGEDGGPPVMIAVERDITEAKARETELARARRAAEQAAQAKARFLATMSHELRTPMNGVIGTAELLQETTLDPDQRFYVDTIVESGQALLEIINDILELSRLEAGAPVLVRRPFEVVDCLQRSIELLRPTARRKGIELTFEIPDRPLPRIEGDDGRLRQIALNLVGNAIKFTDAGGVTVRLATIDVPNGMELTLTVADTGIGIAPDRLSAIFESFTQADDEVSRRFGGTGLGLTISRRIAEQMGGTITVRSEVGVGSVFTLALRLPLASEQPLAVSTVARSSGEPDADVPGGEKEALTGEAGAAAPRVLLAEDNRTNAMIVERMLSKAGIVVTVATDGDTALAAFAAQRPDLVLMDLSMPGRSGFQTLAAIREREAGTGHRVAVVALTADALAETRERCIAAGFDGFLTKPISRDALLAAIAAHRNPEVHASATASPDADCPRVLRRAAGPQLPDRSPTGESATGLDVGSGSHGSGQRPPRRRAAAPLRL